MRLQRFLARAGVASRRGSEDLMTAGRVCVNGAVVRELGAKVDPAADRVEVDGRPVTLGAAAAYYALNKPAGYVTTMSDPQGRPTVASLIPADAPAGLFPVGRLDRDTTGLLLLTSDGELAHRLLHPRHHVWKVYRAVVDGEPSAGDLRALSEGIALDDGPTAPARVSLAWSEGRRAEVEIALREGRKRQVKRMLSAVGHPVTALRRIAFGPVELGALAEGSTRALTAEEVAALREACG
ncbi:MAG: rRNA pseudouridine synthase [Actinobacteria bacterium]|nr:MAG: rRNA pseudouridine synthase [Actinomycetota bacterium]